VRARDTVIRQTTQLALSFQQDAKIQDVFIKKIVVLLPAVA
jgi:hypothetical protein